jgi:phosphoserine phosphatase RsbU/P
MKRADRILVVDDSEDARDITCAALDDGDFGEVTAVASAQEAYRVLGLEDDFYGPPVFDLVLLDIMMQGVDGIEACARIRSSRRYRDVPLLMVSGQSETEVLNQAFVAGANDYVSKPVNPIELLARVRSSLRFKREIERRHAREAELRAKAAEAGSGRGGIDEATGLPDRDAIDQYIRAAADDGVDTALMLMAVDSFAAYRTDRGAAAAEALVRRIGRELGALSAPLSAMLGGYGPGQLMLVAPGAGLAWAEQLAEKARGRIAAIDLSHGSSLLEDQVRISALSGEARGEALLRLPSDLIAGSERMMRDGDALTISEAAE